jgi:hypothetical protein
MPETTLSVAGWAFSATTFRVRFGRIMCMENLLGDKTDVHKRAVHISGKLREQ